jgi:hypothetical protein
MKARTFIASAVATVSIAAVAVPGASAAATSHAGSPRVLGSPNAAGSASQRPVLADRRSRHRHIGVSKHPIVIRRSREGKSVSTPTPTPTPTPESKPIAGPGAGPERGPAPVEPTPIPTPPLPEAPATPEPEAEAETPTTPEPAPGEPTPPPNPEAPAPTGRLLYGNTFDSGFSGWYVQSMSGRATIDSSNAYEGSGAARFEVRPGDKEPDTGSSRSEVIGPTLNVGEEVYVRDEIRVPAGATFNCPWQIIQQLHETEWNGSPGIAVFLNNDHSISFGAGDGSPTYWRGPKLQSETWYDLVYRVKLSRNPAEGFVEVWLNGEPQQLTSGSNRAYGETIQTNHTYLKAGIYRGVASTGVSIIEHDDIAIGTSLAAVMNF